MIKILVSGSLAYDRIMNFPGKFSDYILPDKIHVINVCFNVDGMQEKFGGTAGNIAYNLSLLNEQPLILAAIGKDSESYLNWLRKNNILTEYVKVIDDEFTACAYITTDLADNQITGFNPGAMKHPVGYGLENFGPEDSIMIIAPGNLDDMRDFASKCRERGISFICDPGQSLTKWYKREFLEWINGSMVLISNDYELEIILKLTDMKKIDLLDYTSAIITTLGDKGSSILTRDGNYKITAVKPNIVRDPTGAGDAYRAGLIKGIAGGKDIITSAKMGSVAASYAVEYYGTQEHKFTFEDFVSRYEINFGPLVI
jgi:adenosine kinase